MRKACADRVLRQGELGSMSCKGLAKCRVGARKFVAIAYPRRCFGTAAGGDALVW